MNNFDKKFKLKKAKKMSKKGDNINNKMKTQKYNRFPLNKPLN